MRTSQQDFDRFVPARHAIPSRNPRPLAALADRYPGLDTVLASLAALADNLHVGDRQDRAHAIRDYLGTEFRRYLDEEAETISRLERDGAAGPSAAAILHDLRAELAVAERLLPPVMEGLEQVATVEVCAHPERFSVAALVLCEFLRMHAGYVRDALPSLAAGTFGANPSGRMVGAPRPPGSTGKAVPRRASRSRAARSPVRETGT